MKLGWDSVVSIGKNPMLRSSYIFFVLVPVAVTVLTEYTDVTSFETHLSWRWLSLFWAAAAASLANIIFEVFCPEFVKRYRSFHEFKSAGFGSHDFGTLFKLAAPDVSLMPEECPEDINSYEWTGAYRKIDEELYEIGVRNGQWPSGQMTNTKFWQVKSQILQNSLEYKSKENHEAAAYRYIHAIFSEKNVVARIVCVGLYGISFALLAALAVQNMYVVMRYGLA